MKKSISILILFLLTSLAYPQDSVWQKIKIDENITVSLPKNIEKIDTSFVKEGKRMRFKIFKSENSYSTLVVLTTPNETNINVDDKETLQKALAGMLKGSLKSLEQKGFSCIASDTSIGKIPCKKLSCSNPINVTAINYSFLLNDKMYSFQGFFPQEDDTLNRGLLEIDRLINSVHIDATSVKELQFESKTLSNSYKVGYFIGMLIIPTIIIGLIVYFVRRR